MNSKITTINDLPNEVIEYIIGSLPQYQDIRNCTAVCKKWNVLAKKVMPRSRAVFVNALDKCEIQYETLGSDENLGLKYISKRYAHSACRHKDNMYVFGGFTEYSTAFNDLWRLDLNSRQWTRILTKGSYPVPKAYCSLVTYKDGLVLYGGICAPHDLGIYREGYRMLNELHMYNVENNYWSELYAESTGTEYVTKLSSHTASVHRDFMIVVGGKRNGNYNDAVLRLDIPNLLWSGMEIVGPRPPPRFGHSHISIDDTHILIIGGCTRTSINYGDAWILTMENNYTVGSWRKIPMTCEDVSVEAICFWCHQVCKVGSLIVSFSQCQTPFNRTKYCSWFPPQQMPGHNQQLVNGQDVNINGIRGAIASSSLRRNSSIKRGRSSPMRRVTNVRGKNKPPPINVFIADISNILLPGANVVWRKGRVPGDNAPNDTIMYSLVEGNSELILFGGIQRNETTQNYQCNGLEETNISSVTNNLHFIKAVTKVV